MWRRLLPILFGLSLALNLAVIGAWSVHRLRGSCHRDRALAASPVSLAQRIGMTGARAAEVDDAVAAFRASMRERCRHIESLRRQLLDQVAAETEDPAAIAATSEAMRAAQAEAQARVVTHLLDLKEILEAEEAQRLFDLLRGPGGCAGPGRLLGMPGSRDGSSPSAGACE